jgi:hypothetical protein
MLGARELYVGTLTGLYSIASRISANFLRAGLAGFAIKSEMISVMTESTIIMLTSDTTTRTSVTLALSGEQ